MARKAFPIGPHVHCLIEDACIDLARAVLAIREGENEPDFGLTAELPDQADEEAVIEFRQGLLDIVDI